jgi:hypothetical protein
MTLLPTAVSRFRRPSWDRPAKARPRAVPAGAAAWALLLALVGGSAGAAAELTVAPDTVVPTVAELVTARTGVAVASAVCPDGVPLRQGQVFECSARGQDDTRFVVRVEILDGATGEFNATLVDPLAVRELRPRTEQVLADLVAGRTAAVRGAAGPEIRDAMGPDEFADFAFCRVAHLGALRGVTVVDTAFIHRVRGEGHLQATVAFAEGRLEVGSWWRRESDRWVLYGFNLVEPDAPNRTPAEEVLARRTEEVLRQLGQRSWAEVHGAFAPGLGRAVAVADLQAELEPLVARLGPFRALVVRSMDPGVHGFPVLTVGAAFTGGVARGRFTWMPCGHQWLLFAYEIQ